MGHVYGLLGDLSKSRDFLERAFRLMEKGYGPEHRKLSMILSDLGDVYGRLGDLVSRRDLLERSLYIKEKEYSYGAERPPYYWLFDGGPIRRQPKQFGTNDIHTP